MTLRLIVGRANIGKTGAALQAVRDARASGLNPVLILPSQPDVQRAADELSKASPLGFRVQTFDAFLGDAWNQRGDGRIIISSAARGLLAASAARRSGVSSGMGELAAVCAGTLAQQCGEAWRDREPVIAGPGSRLACTILEYRDSLRGLGLIEREEAAYAMAAISDPNPAPLVIHRFIDFAPWQERLILGLARSREVIVTLTWEDGFAPTSALDQLVVRLSGQVVVTEGELFQTKPELAVVANGLFSNPSGSDFGGAVRFSLAEGYEAEAHRIAEEVGLAVTEYGSSDTHTSIAVVFRQPERHYRFLREAFEEAGIDAEFDVRLPLGSTAFGAAILSFLRFVLTGDRDPLLAVVKSPFAGCTREMAVALDRDWRKQGVTDPGVLINDIGRASKELQSVLRGARSMAGVGIDASVAAGLASLVSRLFVLGYGRGMADAVPVDDASAHAAAVRVLGEVALLNDADLTLRDVVDALRGAVVTTPVEERPGVVQVTAVDRIRGRRYDTVIIGGLNTDEFPAAPAEHLLPGSSVARVLESFGGTGEPPRGGEYEQLLFYTALTRAQHRVVLSARTADSDGDPAGVSPLFEDVADFYRPENDSEAHPEHQFRALSQPPRATGLTTQREELRAGAAAGDDLRSYGALWRSRRRLSGLDEDSSLEWLTSSDVYSPSALEVYLECPYRWFYTRAVRPGVLEVQFDARNQGSFAHEVLARTYSALGELDAKRVTEENKRAVTELARTQWQLVDQEQGLPANVLERSQRRVTLAWVEKVIERDASFALGFAPSRLEWSFGREDDEPLDLGGFRMRGIVDRVDVDDAGHAVVIDYKRSGGPSAADILKKRKIQVPLYFEAVRRALGLEPVAGLYRGLQSGADRGLILAESEISGAFIRTDIRCRVEYDSIIEGALELAHEAVAGIRSGSIGQTPNNPDSCSRCEALAVCGGAR